MLDFGDQVALAARLAATCPRSARASGPRFRVVLLDEYQDTSHAQLVLLRALFGGGHGDRGRRPAPVDLRLARGVSAGNLQGFPTRLPAVDADGARAAAPRYLSTSWRNDAARPRRRQRRRRAAAPAAAWVDAAPRSACRHSRPARCGPGSRCRRRGTRRSRTRRAGRRGVAARWRAGSRRAHGAARASTAAVLCRNRSQFPLRRGRAAGAGLPVEVVGLGGLLHVPEVADLRGRAARCCTTPPAATRSMRLLTGPACRLGAARPGRRSAAGRRSWCAAGAGRRAGADPSAETAHDASASSRRSTSCRRRAGGRVGAASCPTRPEHGWSGSASTLRELRGRTGLALPDLVAEVERALLLDVEVTARPGVAARPRPAPTSTRSSRSRPASPRPGRPGRPSAASSPGSPRPTSGSGASTPRSPRSTRRRAGADRARGEGPGVGRRRRARAGRGHVPHREHPRRLADLVRVARRLVRGAAVPVARRRPPAAAVAARGGAQPGRPGRVVRGVPAAGTRPRGRRGAAAGVRGGDPGPRRCSPCRVRCGARAARRRPPRASWRRWPALARQGPDPAGCGSRVGEPPEDGAANPRDRSRPPSGPSTRSARPARAWRRRPPWSGAFLAGTRRPAGRAAATADDRGTAAVRPRRGPRRASWRGGTARPACCSPNARPGARGRSASSCPRTCPPRRSSRSRPTPRRSPTGCAARCRSRRSRRPGAGARSTPGWSGASASAALVDLEELPGAADDAETDVDLEELQRRFLAGEWAGRTPEAVEVAVETPVAGVVVRGRIDAVFRYETPDGPRWDVVDWKTGRRRAARRAAGPRRPAGAVPAGLVTAAGRAGRARLRGVLPRGDRRDGPARGAARRDRPDRAARRAGRARLGSGRPETRQR